MKNLIQNLKKIISTKKHQDSKGFLLVTACLMLAATSTISMAMFARSNAFIQATERSQNKIIAFHMAEAGVDMALKQLTTNSSYTGVSYTSLNTSTTQGGYKIAITTPDDNSNVRIIQATGYSPSYTTSDRAYQSRSVTSYVKLATSNFDFGAFAVDKLKFKGAGGVDSYNSDDGAYNPANPGSNGDIGTDSGDDDHIKLQDSTKIKGNITVGVGSDPGDVVQITGTATVSGTKSAATSARSYESKTTTATSEGDLKIKKTTTYYLTPGTHRFDSIKIEDTGVLSALGAVTIYVDGKVEIGGNGVQTLNNKPTNFLLYATGDKDIKFKGSSDFYGAVFAPESKVGVKKNIAIYGAIIAKVFKDNGDEDDDGEGSIHFDEALKTVGISNTNGAPTQLAYNENATSSWGTGSA
ncbi:MAG: hypothetical protein EXS63_05365 [Candidatus Omnitrophica bacterium]|nr:hypothetical protein [Candidatus Omnitrophota bacterium]